MLDVRHSSTLDWLEYEPLQTNTACQRPQEILAYRSPGHEGEGSTAANPAYDGLAIDIAGVCYDDTVFRRWLFRLLANLGLRARYEPLFYLWDVEFYDDVCAGHRDYRSALHDFLRTCGMPDRDCEEALAAASARRKRLEEKRRPFPQVIATLAALNAQGVTLTAVANAPFEKSMVEQKLAALGLLNFFSTVISSCDLGVPVPSPAFFEAAFPESVGDRQNLAVVSNKPRHLASAKCAGLTTVAVNFNDAAMADIYLGQITELGAKVRFRKKRQMAG